ncbi:PREDICTED: R3H domain-containing protein 1-like isoform X3 [Poecilia mexicana]|uniref:R3H domain-containing protein 1-like isoform X3 n=1 Tax=Poecilia mexicana TaxID=48701 RepID=UPI00072DFA6F|nr:PREDICTED: R3H domain-containing protein 1-like isoform X3 [Poecilia mexicana]
MRMSDIADAETMKVPEDAASPARDNTAKPEVRDQSHGSKEEHGGNNKKDIQPVKYSKSSTRLKLVRSLAVCEESFPLPIPEPSAAPQQDGLLPPPAFENEERGAKDQAEKEGGCDKVDKPEKAPRKMLSRDSSQDYTDSTGIDLHEFLVNTLKSNPRDRIMLLKLEQDILDFISNNETQKRKFPPMTSYHRMLLHRVAAYFGMDHNVDPSGKSVVINKTINTRIPDQKFSEHIKDDRADDFQKRYILKRDNASFDREDSTIRMRLKADKRSKSMEEREEEYQRARERIFAHDGEHFLLDRSAQEEHACMNTQQRRQMFRLRAGQSGASRQSSSETETLPRHGEPRPWSSTDSSDSSNRLAPRPAITKASSFSGLVRGDSTASSKSTGKLSKTGSESCSSVGSSSSSLSRPHLPLQIPAASRSVVPGNPLPHRAVDTRVPGHPEASKSGPSQLLASAGDTSGYYMLPLDAAGIPPGSILINPHTGKPFMHPDGSAVVYNPPAGRIPQQGKTPPQPIPAASQQQQPANHVHSQPVYPPLQPSSEPVHNPTVSYPLHPPLPPSQFLPVCPNQQYTVPDVLSAQFGHMTLLQQPSSDGGGSVSAPDGRHFPSPYTNPSAVVLQGAPPPQVSGYMVAGPSGGHPGVLQGQHVPTAPNLAYSNAGPAPFPALNQPLLQQHAYIQQPVQQMSTCYCSPAHHPQCSNQQQPPLPQYRPPLNPLTYNCPQSQNLPQQQVHQAMMPNPASSYQTVVGVQPTPSLALTGNQQSNMANQMQGMMVQYPPMQSYQVSVPQQTYQQPMFVTCQPGQGAVAVSGMQPCYGLLPTNQHTTMSSTVSFLPAPMMEPLQFPQSSSPCVSQQHPGQQYAGLLPAAPGGGMVMLQMAAPPCQQPRASSPCQRKQPSHKHSDQQQQRGRRPADVPQTPDNTQSSLPSSPALTPSPCQPPHIKALSSGVSPIPILSHHPQLPTAFIHTGQGEAHYSLLGQPLQYKPSSIRPPLLHTAHMVAKHQGPLGVWRSGHGRKSSRKPLSSDLSVCREEISDGTASFFK